MKYLYLTFILILSIFYQQTGFSEDSLYSGEVVIGYKNNLNIGLLNYEFLTGNPIPKNILHTNFVRLKKCILNHDIACVGSYIIFSNSAENGTKINLKSGSVSIKSMDEFKKDYDKIITLSVVEAFKNQQEKDLPFPYAGAKVGNGKVWLNYFCNAEKQDQCYFIIYSINLG